jgi:hypothetical protein
MEDTNPGTTSTSPVPPPVTGNGPILLSEHPNPSLPKPDQASHVSRTLARIHNGILEWIHLREDICSTLAFWALSTWFNDVLPIIPSIVISGSSLEATELLRALKVFCAKPSPLLARFKKSDLSALDHYRTLFVCEPNLSQDLASFLGLMTSSELKTVIGGDLIGCRRSVAVYVGERSPVGLIPYSIPISIPPSPNVAVRGYGNWQMTETLRQTIERYVTENSVRVQQSAFQPAGLYPDATEIARSLGNCIVGDTALQNRVVDLLRTEDDQRLSQWIDTGEAILIEAALSLSRKQPEHIYAREIAVQANRLLDLRGERIRLTPEKVGKGLRKIGLPTRRLNHSGNGLVLDHATISRLEQLAAMYIGEDFLKEGEVQTDSEATEKKEFKQVM